MDLDKKSGLESPSSDTPPQPRPGVIAGLDSILLKAAPIEPSWVLTGRPEARSGSHSASRDGGSSTHVWDCTAGSFKWSFGWDETVLILDGSVEVTSPDGRTTLLKEGDVAYFSAGTTWVWKIDRYVRKLAFLHRPASKPERFLRTVRTQLLNRSTAFKVGLVAAAMASVAAMVTLE